VRRSVTLSLTFGLTIALTSIGPLFAQDAKKDAGKPAETKPAEKKPADTKPADTKPAASSETKKAAAPAEAPLPTIPPEVEAKLEAARKAVAEAIVAAQDAGLVETSIDPPPIVDILVTGRALDARDLKARKGVSPEVFGAWFTGYGKPLEGITPQENVRIMQPSDGLKTLYDQRAGILARHIEAVRKAKAAAAPKLAPAPATTPMPTPSDSKKAETKKEAAKPAEEKKAETKPADSKPADVKKDAPKPADSKPADAKKTEEKKK
jgi:hypothetical protein